MAATQMLAGFHAVIARLRELGAVSVRKMDGVVETIKFPLPKGLKRDAP